MKDKWSNNGYEGEDLKPYTEPEEDEEDFEDTKRTGDGGYGLHSRKIKEALTNQKYNKVIASYLLLGRKTEKVGDQGAPGLPRHRCGLPATPPSGQALAKAAATTKATGFILHLQPPAPTQRLLGPSPTPLHPKRSPTSTGDKEERWLLGRKASCSTAGSGSRGLPPSSPMVHSVHNPNKAEIPERRRDSMSTPNNLPPAW